MINIDPDDVIETKNIKKFKKRTRLIIKKHQIQVLNEIIDYAKKIKLTLDLDIKFDVKVIGNKRK